MFSHMAAILSVTSVTPGKTLQEGTKVRSFSRCLVAVFSNAVNLRVNFGIRKIPPVDSLSISGVGHDEEVRFLSVFNFLTR